MCKKPKIETPAVQPAAAPAPAVVETTNKQTEVATPTEKKKRNALGKNKLTIARSTGSGTGMNI